MCRYLRKTCLIVAVSYGISCCSYCTLSTTTRGDRLKRRVEFEWEKKKNTNRFPRHSNSHTWYVGYLLRKVTRSSQLTDTVWREQTWKQRNWNRIPRHCTFHTRHAGYQPERMKQRSFITCMRSTMYSGCEISLYNVRESIPSLLTSIFIRNQTLHSVSTLCKICMFVLGEKFNRGNSFRNS